MPPEIRDNQTLVVYYCSRIKKYANKNDCIISCESYLSEAEISIRYAIIIIYKYNNYLNWFTSTETL